MEKIKLKHKLSNRIREYLHSVLKHNKISSYLINKSDFYYAKRNAKNVKKCKIPHVYTQEKTINDILDKHASVCRFGDGEYKWMCNIFQWSYQDYNKEMARELMRIIKSNKDDVLICINKKETWLSDEYSKTGYPSYWDITLGKYRNKFYRLLDLNRYYYNSDFNRGYAFDDTDYKKVEERFKKIESIWGGQDIVIIEGRYTRLGYGNDCLNNAKSIKRILCPEKNAYDVIDKIKSYVVKNIDTNTQILISLGPTAKILCYYFAEKGYQAIDIGHFDINYEYFLMKAKEVVPVKNKYTNEATHLGGDKCEDIKDPNYLSQIIAEIYE